MRHVFVGLRSNSLTAGLESLFGWRVTGGKLFSYLWSFAVCKGTYNAKITITWGLHGDACLLEIDQQCIL